ncbi:MAG: DEAD/DEAH box helicase family protein [Atopobiaceae bacterium]|nr:DEAD/DEAH box helicase family protein [Atopobiaceae bacterium]
MGLKDLNIRSEYRTKMSDIAKEFLVPVLSEAVTYDRAVGFFSSSALAEMAKGIGRIAQRGGRIRLIASPNLSEEDIKAIESGYARRERIRQRLLEGLVDIDMLGMADKNCLNMLADLIASGLLDIRIAFAESRTGYGIYHEKVAIVTDEVGDKVAFSGSMNESATAMRENYEAIDVFRSWDDPEDRVRSKEAAFEAIWDDREPGVSTFDFPEVKDEIVRRYRTSRPDYTNDLVMMDVEYSGHASRGRRYPYPEVPDEYTLRGYQEEAIAEWRKRGFRGIYDMATGTGKTVTALASIVELCQYVGNELAVVIVCPFQHLVDQWVKDIELFNIEPIIGYSTSPQRDWERRLDHAIRNQKFGVKGSKFFCFVCTNGTYAATRVQRMLGKIRKQKLLVVDEAHNFGAEYIRSLLREDFQYRLALSATIERYGDNEGTDALFSYFGERCIKYTLEEAIYGRGAEPPCLTPYRYHPVIVYLEDEELRQYSALSAEIAKAMRVGRDGKRKLTEQGKMLALKRARIVAAAHGKLPALRREIAPYVDDNYMLVYCGATLVEIDGGVVPGVDDYEIRQIDAVTHLLGNGLNMRVRQFTSRESSAEREEIKEMFADADLQALIAIKCLDEGVNIPMIKTAFILASTTNPREYVQRRGRLLRKDREGKKLRAEIYDFVTLPRPAEEAGFLPDEETCGEKRLVYNELVRAREFAELAENCTEASEILDEIEEGFFGLDGMTAFGIEGEE